VQLTDADLGAIDDAASQIEIAGDRYAPQQLAMVGREAPLVGTAAKPSLSPSAGGVMLRVGQPGLRAPGLRV